MRYDSLMPSKANDFHVTTTDDDRRQPFHKLDRY